MRIYWIILLALSISVSQAVSGLSATEVYSIVGKSVYPVYGFDSKQNKRKSAGTGVAVSAQLLATNCHIARNADSYIVKIKNDFRKAKLVYQDFSHDLCLLEIPGEKFQPVEFRDSSTVDIGEEVYAIGNPHGLEKSISRGIISNKHKFLGDTVLQTDATISFGSSGGGLFDTEGRLVGITRAGHRFKDIAFAVPSDWITNILNAAKTTKHAMGINKIISESLQKEYEKIHITTETLGHYGKDSVGLFRYKHRCFIGLKGIRLQENKKENQGVLIWFPFHPNVVYFAPYDKSVNRAFIKLIKHGHVKRTTGSMSLEKINTVSILPEILRTSDIVARRFDVSPAKQFEGAHQIFLHYPDMYDNYKENMIKFGLVGFKKAFKSYEQRCVIKNTRSE